MRILLVCPDWFPYSAGLSQSALELSQELIKDGNKVVVATSGRGKHDDKGLKLIEVPLLFVMLGRNPICRGVYRTLRKEIKKADCVILFSYMFELNFRISLLRFFKFFNKPLIHMYRGSLENYGLKGVGLTTKFGKWLWDNTCAWFIFRGTDATISNSGPTLKVMHKKYFVKPEKLHYVKTGMYLDQFKISKGEEKRIVFIGRLVDNKGVLLFPKIMKVIPKDWTFTIFGDGPLKPMVQKLAKKYKNIDYRGNRPYEELKETMSHSAINILPSYAEGSPRSVLDAACSGVPSICFDVGDVVNTIPKGTGFVIPRYNVKRFCNRLKYLIEDKEMRLSMGANARTFAQKELDWKIVYKKTFDIIKKIVKK